MFKKGDIVIHDIFGSGKVIDTNGRKVNVIFDNGSKKIILDDYLFSNEKINFIEIPFEYGESFFMIDEKTAARYFRNKPEEQLIKSIINRGIKKLVHFTSSENVENILAHGLLSISILTKNKIPYVSNDNIRLDKKLDGINISIENINLYLLNIFQKNYKRDYVIIELSPSLLYILFYEKEGRKKLIKREYYDYNAAALDTCSSEYNIEIMFSKKLYKKNKFFDRYNKADNIPTCIQAEIIIKDYIPLQYIRNIKTMKGKLIWQNDQYL